MKKIFWLFLCFIVISGCKSGVNSCDIEKLILDDKDFPGQVTSDPIDSPIADAPPLSVERIFYIETSSSIDIVQQDVIRFRFAQAASNFWEDGEKEVFKTDEYRGQWKLPPGFDSSELVADQSHLACGLVLSERTCRWIARYGAYYIYLRSDISNNGMTEDTFLDIVKKIDNHLLHCQ